MRYREASSWLRQRVEARLLAILPDAVLTARDGAGVPQRIEGAVLLELITKWQTSHAPGAAVLYDNPRSKVMTQPSRGGRREAMPKVQVLDIEGNTIAVRGIVWWGIRVTLETPSSAIAVDVASPARRKLHEWGLKVCQLIAADHKRFSKRIFADILEMRFGTDGCTEDDINKLWPRLRKASGWTGTRIPIAERISKDEVAALLIKAGLLNRVGSKTRAPRHRYKLDVFQ